MGNILKRSITGTLYLIIIIGSILLGRYSFGLVFMAINIIALNEFFNIVTDKKYFPDKYPGIFTGAALSVTTFFVSSGMYDNKLFLIFILLFVLIFIREIFRNKQFPFINIALTVLGILYVSLPLSLLNYIVFPKFQPDGYTYEIILGYLVLIWTNDTSAYVFGISLGKHKLFKRISPKKTWEGFAGGTIVTIVVAILIHKALPSLDMVDMLVFGSIVSIIGVAGDLSESLLKRSVSIKDTGNILPGHGGVLDRIDSLLLTSPLIFGYLMMVK